MTRKEVCKETGLSVKTLRLYEEKGLIAPAKEYRNGREYRAYTPELVKQLEQIATLRRALFTMEEIKTMQEQPEKIPDIFQCYQQWLRQQEQQFTLLRQAAENIPTENLSSMEHLLSGLTPIAASMPLPAMDRKPNFKRLDEMEEPPRHVTEQVDLDDMVPNATVFRQVNIMVDRDRGNDANLALGQLQATVRSFQEESGSGPVRGKQTVPKWRRILSGCLNTALVLMVLGVLVAAQIFRNEPPQPLVVVFFVLLAARVLLSAIPAWLHHRSWLKQAQEADAKNTSPDAYAKARKRRVVLIGAGAAGILVLVLGIFALTRYLYAQAHPDTDYRVCFAIPSPVGNQDLRAMEKVLSPLVGDLDENGAAVTAVDLLETRSNVIHHTKTHGDYHGPDYLKYCAENGVYSLYFITDTAMRSYSIWDAFKPSQYCRPLPEDLADSEDPCLADLSGTGLFRAADLESLPVYGCISKSATDEEYDFAVELLRKILAE